MYSSQTKKILKHIKTHKKGITSLEAFSLYGITRLSACIYILRREMNLDIKTIRCSGTTRDGHRCNFARYVMENKEEIKK